MSKEKPKNFFDIIVDIIIIVLSILVIYWFIQLIFGGSPGLSEFNFALIILIIGFFIKPTSLFIKLISSLIFSKLCFISTLTSPISR